MKTNQILLALMLLGTLLLAGCDTEAKVGALQSESQSVELGNAESVRVEIEFGAGNLQVSGGADKLLEADFTYNVAKLKPEVAYTDGHLSVRQPDTRGWPALQYLTDFQNRWGLRLSEEVPLDLRVIAGGGTSNLQLAGLPLTRLDVDLGAGISTIDLRGDWAQDLEVMIDAGATDLTVLLPREVGARVEVESGPHTIVATGLSREENVYTNDAYGVSEVTMRVDLQVGIGTIDLEVEEAAAASE